VGVRGRGFAYMKRPVYTLLGAIGAVLTFVASVMLVITAFRQGILWGLLVLLCHPIFPILFAILHWSETKRWAVLYIVGALLMAPMGSRVQENYSQGRGVTVDL
jgi:hypothetical protein